MIKSRDWDWLVFQRKRLIGCYMVQFRQEEKDYKVYDVGQITNIKMQGDFFCIDVEKKNWFLYGFDLILPEITEDDDNIIIQDKILDIRCVILTKKS